VAAAYRAQPTTIREVTDVPEFEQVRYAVSGAVAAVSLHRPQARNGYTMRMADELVAALDLADADPDVRAVVLTGSGADFSVGADLSGGSLDAAAPDDDGVGFHEPAGRVSLRIFALHKPVVAALRGAAVGAGSTIPLAADYRLAGTDTRFGFVFTRRGIVPEGASTWFLPRLVGMGRALDWMVSGRVFDAAEAHAAGLVHQLHDPESVLAAAQDLAAELAARTAPVAVALTRQMLYRMSAQDSPFPARDFDSRMIAAIPTNPDALEGVRSFLERRPPEFPGRVPADLPEDLPWSPS
jgi:enoyl-CoA hydratase/carnithine racemase